MRIRPSHLSTLAFFFLFLGTYCNFLAIMSNGGKMPVYTTDNLHYNPGTHFLFSNKSEVNHFYLTDILSFLGHRSIGDILLYIGSALIGVLIVALIISNIFEEEKDVSS